MASAPPPTATPGEELLKRPIYIYDIPDTLLSSLQPREGFEPRPQEEGAPTSAPLSDPPEIATATSCALCNFHGRTVADQRSHARSDFHAFNLKRKSRGQPAVNEAEFERLLEELNESISGSESEGSSESEAEKDVDNVAELMRRKMKLAADPEGAVDAQVGARGRKQGPGNAPIVWFGSPTLPEEVSLGVYKAVFSNLEQTNASYLPALSSKQLRNPQNQDRHIFMCMIGGGHFAGMVVSLTPKAHAQGNAKGEYPAHVLAHKTFHRYTTRRKQGGSQSSNDNAKGNAHSAGAGIRRYNEAALTAEVRELLCSWRELLDTADLLFIRATGNANRQTLFNFADSPLAKGDPRIRGFPFSTRRATQSELLRCFTELTRLKVSRISAESLETAEKQPTPPKKEKKKEKEPEMTPEEEDLYTHTYQLQSTIKRQKVQQLLNYLVKNKLDPNFEFYPKAKNHHAPTPLHMAAHLAHPAVISALLSKAKADPTVANGEGKTAYDLASTRAARDAFRVARHELGERACDWEEAHVPAALTAAEAKQRAEEEKAEQEKAEKERRQRELEKIGKEEMERREAEEKEKLKGWGLGGRVKGARKLGDESSPVIKGLEGLGREEVEMRGVSEEVKRRIERERRARAAEERIRRMQGR